MKKLLFLIVLIPSLSFADRLGSLKSNAEVLLSTQSTSSDPLTLSTATVNKQLRAVPGLGIYTTNGYGIEVSTPVDGVQLGSNAIGLIMDSVKLQILTFSGVNLTMDGTKVQIDNVPLKLGAAAPLQALGGIEIPFSPCDGFLNGGKLTTNGSGAVACGDDISGGGGGGSSTLAIATGTAGVFTQYTTTGTQAVVFQQNQFLTSQVNGSTAAVSMNTSSVTLYGANIPAAAISAGSLGSSVIASSVAVAKVGVVQMNFSGSPSGSNFARGDGTWATPSGSGDVVTTATQTLSGFNTFTGSATLKGATIVGNATYTPLPDNPLSVVGNTSNFLQFNVQNTSADVNASGDIVITNNLGTNTSGYVNLGINSSSYTSASFSVVGSSDSYLYASNKNFAIGTMDAGNDAWLKFFTGGTTSSNVRMTIDNFGGVTVNSGSMTVANTSGWTVSNSTFVVNTATNVILQANGVNFPLYQTTGYFNIADTTTQSSALVIPTGYQFQCAPMETWAFEANLAVTGITNGTEYGMNGPTGSTVTMVVWGNTSAVGTFSMNTVTALNTADTVAMVTSNGTALAVRLTGTMQCSTTAGTVSLQWKSVTGGNTSTIKAGSYWKASRIN